jgi:hypothetical protein
MVFALEKLFAKIFLFLSDDFGIKGGNNLYDGLPLYSVYIFCFFTLA